MLIAPWDDVEHTQVLHAGRRVEMAIDDREIGSEIDLRPILFSYRIGLPRAS